MTQYLLDTNTCVEWMRAKNQTLLARLRNVPRTQLRLCSVVVGELTYGALRSANPALNSLRLQSLFASIVSLPYDDDAAVSYAKIRFDLANLGTPIGPNDTLIAAIALTHGLTLVTHNVREFSRVSGLAIEDWQV